MSSGWLSEEDRTQIPIDSNSFLFRMQADDSLYRGGLDMKKKSKTKRPRKPDPAGDMLSSSDEKTLE